MRRFVRGTLLLLALYWATLFVLTHVPISLESPVRHFDKFVHFLAYAGLGAGLIAALPFAWRRSVGGLLLVIAIACLYGVADEVIQGFVPGRTASLADWIADAAGASFGAATAWSIAALARSRMRHSRGRSAPLDSVRA